MSSIIDRDALVKELEDRKIHYVRTLIAENDEQLRGKIRELEMLISKYSKPPTAA